MASVESSNRSDRRLLPRPNTSRFTPPGLNCDAPDSHKFAPFSVAPTPAFSLPRASAAAPRLRPLHVRPAPAEGNS